MQQKNNLLLAGDIGATKTTLALYEVATEPGSPLRQQTFQNAGYADFDSLLQEFLGAKKAAPATVCLGVAGPVMANAVHDDQSQLVDRRLSVAGPFRFPSG